MTDAIGWVMIAGAMLAYARSTHAAPTSDAPARVPNAEVEVDPTRWRHDGTQEFVHRDGNRQPFDDPYLRSFE